MAPAILLVGDQHDVLMLLHSALDTLGIPELEIVEAASSEAALDVIRAQPVDLLVTDHSLPRLNALELMGAARAALPDLPAILIAGSTDRKLRDDLLRGGASAVFSKPVPLGDFLAAAERALGLAEGTPPEVPTESPGAVIGAADLLANYRQQHGLNAVFVITNRGRIAERAGDLPDRSMEVSLISGLAACFAAGLKVAESNRQESPIQHTVFSGGDQDLILLPIDPVHAVVVAGQGLAAHEKLPATLQSLTGLVDQLTRSLRQRTTGRAEGAPAARPAQELDAILDSAAEQAMTQEELDAYWDSAAARHANKPMSDDVISYDQARKMGLTPDSDKE